MSQSSAILALWGSQEGEEYVCDLAATGLQPLLTVSTEELRVREHTGYWPQDS